MSEPSQEFLRLGQVNAWLEELGIRPRQTRVLIEEGIIKGAPVRPQKNGNTGQRQFIRGRAKGESTNYYRKSQIKEALKL
jgi:hypothetical protein